MKKHVLIRWISGMNSLLTSFRFTQSAVPVTPERGAKMLRTICESGKRLSTLVSNLLDSATAAREGRLAIEFAPLDVVGAVEGTVEQPGPALTRPGRLGRPAR
jgi:K+-sensing histidine kinase KdpD